MFLGQGRILPQVEELGRTSAFLAQMEHVMGRDSVFSRISREEVDFLAQLMPCYQAPAGTLLIKEGEASGFLVFVMAGTIEIRKMNHEGHRAVLARVGPGSTLGEMSLLDALPRSADCVTMEPTTFAVLDRSSMDLLVRNNPALVNKILTQIILILSERVRQLSDILSETLQTPD